MFVQKYIISVIGVFPSTSTKVASTSNYGGRNGGLDALQKKAVECLHKEIKLQSEATSIRCSAVTER